MLVECFGVTVGKSKQLFSSIIYMLTGRCAMYRRIIYLCISSISVTWCTRQAIKYSIQPGAACYATQPMRFSSRSHKTQTQYHNLSEYALKEDPRKHHCLILLLAGDTGYISMLVQNQPIFHSFQTSSIQL